MRKLHCLNRLPAVAPRLRGLLLGLAWFTSFGAVAQTTCLPVGGLEFGPYDYRAAPAAKLHIVESYHFNRDVEMLRKGQSTVNIGEDLEFVLRYFPNHIRALNAMLKLGKRERTNRPRGNKDTIECWFQRARAFRPDDGSVSLVYALWLLHVGQKPLAVRELSAARKSTEVGTANFEYNMGLAYLEVGDFENSLQAAHRAYAMGFDLPGLQNRLKRAGKWRDPPPAPPRPQSTEAKRPVTSAPTAGAVPEADRP